MNFLAKATDFIGGSLFKEIKDGVMKYFPPRMTPQEKANFEIQMERLLFEKRIEANKVLTDAAITLDKRISEQEGTAKDLLSLPIIGRLVLFLRGLQRPAWGFFTMYADFIWFSSDKTYTEQQQTALIMINLLVLGFLFGERTVLNFKPFIMKWLSRKS